MPQTAKTSAKGVGTLNIPEDCGKNLTLQMNLELGGPWLLCFCKRSLSDSKDGLLSWKGLDWAVLIWNFEISNSFCLFFVCLFLEWPLGEKTYLYRHCFLWLTDSSRLYATILSR